MDLYEMKDELVIKAELPGLHKEDIDISLEGNTLVIKGEKKTEEVPQEASYCSCERCFGQFYRSLEPPFHVDADKVSSSYSDGILEIRLHKAEEAKSKHIEIKAK